MRIGVIGAGQLGQMLGFAGRDLGIECRFIDPSESPPAASAGDVVRAEFDDMDALAALASVCDVVTYEFENVAVEALEAIAADAAIYPPPRALRLAQDRLTEKRLFESVGVPCAAYRTVDSHEDLCKAVAELGLPLVLKTRRFGYDGKGQAVIRAEDELESAWAALGGRALIAETMVPFDFEISAIAARSLDGEVVVWPLTHNVHRDGILHTSRAPVEDAALTASASHFMHRLLEHLEYVGVLALELFVVGDSLLANEFAPRVHNSGHWTIEGAETSQFTNHLLAISGRRPGPASCPRHAGMLNLIGTIPDAARRIRDSGIVMHDYGKAPRPGRKLGHITVVGDSAAERDQMLSDIEKSVTWRTPRPGHRP